MGEAEILEEFSLAQKEKLEKRKNRYKPMEWDSYSIHTLFRLLKAEVDELHVEIEKKDYKRAEEEACDVGNFALFIWKKTRD